MDKLIISYINTSSPKYGDVWQLREEILRKPLGLSLKNEDLTWDHVDTIFIAEHNNKVIGCLMLHKVAGAHIKLRQMAVYSEWQGMGVGSRLVKAAEEFCIHKGYNRIGLHARNIATGFYKSLGYTISGSEFFEVGIPHYAMEKKIGLAVNG